MFPQASAWLMPVKSTRASTWPPVIIIRPCHRISITVGWNPFDLSLQFLLPSIRNHHIVEAPLLCSVCEPGFSKLSILSQSSLVNPGPRQRAAIRHKKRFRAAGVNQKYRFDIWSSFRQKRAFLMRVKRRAVHLGGALEWVAGKKGWMGVGFY